MSSGSLKEVAKSTKSLIQQLEYESIASFKKIEVNFKIESETLIVYIKQMAIADRISIDDATEIIEKYKLEGGNN